MLDTIRIAWQKFNIYGRMKILWHLNFLVFYIMYLLGIIRPFVKKVKLDPRIDYYCKLDYLVPKGQSRLHHVKLCGGAGYSYDLYRILACFGNKVKFNYRFGDITHTFDSPTFVKSRPIISENENSILLPLDIYRHLHFIPDKTPFRNKINMAVWRGHTYQPHRKNFISVTEKLPFCNVADTSTTSLKKNPNTWMPMSEQLKYKIIFSVEGAEVATNLKWIMGSQSLCFMVRPKYETWFREGLLIPGFHYVEIADDLSDISEKFHHYTTYIEKAEEIIKNANAYVEEFKDPDRQYELAKAVAYKYFQITGEIR